MSSILRRRSAPAGEATETLPANIPLPNDSDFSSSETPVQKISRTKKETRKRRTTFIFLLGILFGIITAGYFAKDSDLIDFLPELNELTMDSIFDVMPAGLILDLRELINGERELTQGYEAFAVGAQAREEGLGVHHPVIMVPGVISTGLESWGTSNISRPYFRKRLWGSWSMMRALVLDKENWRNHLMLDKQTGLDPPNVKLRPAQGFDAADFFITGYWIWNKIIENLASLGYDPNSSFTAAYDWRLSYQNLETRDKYFTKLKTHIELSNIATGKKAVLISHSMGSPVTFYFFHWVASETGGKGGQDWVERYVDSWINVSGCMLGAIKGVPAILSGEMRDTAQLNPFAVYGLEKFLNKDERAELFRAMPGISSMMPMGGDAVWGNLTWAPDDQSGQIHSYGSLLNFRKDLNGSIPDRNLTVSGALDYIMKTTEDWYQDQLRGSYSQGVAHTAAEVAANELDNRKWTNPLESRLPLAPSLKVYCFYGVGKPTERAYYYRAPEFPEFTKLNVTIDTSMIQGDVDRGVILGEGDGTVPILSSGYMCSKGWHLKRFNPAGAKITVVEMPHEPDRFSPRGGANTAEHVDILGRQNLNELIMKVAAGQGHTIESSIVSNIREYADKVKVYEEP
ncbi:phospholipid:diacylglycerol acyltransferase [Microdochium nivale]|nr:phospholipid:diacylglycerol acyltransferase [Microdochium nivale]